MFIVTFVIIILAIVGLAFYVLGKRRQSEQAHPHTWGLGVDTVVDYTKKVTIRTNQLTITGWQSVEKEHTIQYSVVKKKWGLFPVYYDTCEIKGAYTANDPFRHTFHNLPNGMGYQVEISNFGSLGRGCLNIELE